MIGLHLPDRPLALLALGAHPDDVEIGCGGTLLRLASERPLTAAVHVLTGTPAREAEARAAAQAFLGPDVSVFCHGLPDGRLPAFWGDLKGTLEGIAVGFRPDLILAPRPDDAHQDHRLIGELVSTVWRDSLVLHYEIPKWDGDLRQVTHYLPLDAEKAHRKVALLREAFPSQRTRDWWSDETFLGLMRIRGIECRAPYAEGFLATKVLLAT